jgi:hypothetical protein
MREDEYDTFLTDPGDYNVPHQIARMGEELAD